MKTGETTLKNSLALSYKAKHNLTIWSSSCALRYLPNWFLTVYVHAKTCMLVVIVALFIIHYHPEQKGTKVSFNWWIYEQNVVHSYNGIWFSYKNKWLLIPEETWRKHRCILLRSHSEKATHCIIPYMTYWKRYYFRDRKQFSSCQRCRRKQGWIAKSTGIFFKAVKLSCT